MNQRGRADNPDIQGIHIKPHYFSGHKRLKMLLMIYQRFILVSNNIPEETAAGLLSIRCCCSQMISLFEPSLSNLKRKWTFRGVFLNSHLSFLLLYFACCLLQVKCRSCGRSETWEQRVEHRNENPRPFLLWGNSAYHCAYITTLYHMIMFIK